MLGAGHKLRYPIRLYGGRGEAKRLRRGKGSLAKMTYGTHSSLITLPINLWRNSDLLKKEPFSSSNIDQFRAI